MNTPESIKRAYDKAAAKYAAEFWNEPDRKHFDRVMLDWLAGQLAGDETVLEIGCGPGQISGYLSRQGVTCVATDISCQIIEYGKRYFPDVRFEVQDFFDLKYEDGSFGAVLAFYAIVNLPLGEAKGVFEEVRRVLRKDGLFLCAFHILEQDEKLEVTEFFGEKVDALTFYFHDVDDMKRLVESLGFRVVDILIRYPYPGAEHPSKRSYFILRKAG